MRLAIDNLEFARPYFGQLFDARFGSTQVAGGFQPDRVLIVVFPNDVEVMQFCFTVIDRSHKAPRQRVFLVQRIMVGHGIDPKALVD